ncbi:MAG: hypothetical protein LC634_08635 [Sphingomonadales bacterium]|nr:hypothetical protein [Sphingomonadales bacterium]
MLEARGEGSWLYLSGKLKPEDPNEKVSVSFTFGNPSVLYDNQYYPIAGSYGDLTNFDARDLKGAGVSIHGPDSDTRALLSKEDDYFFGGSGRDVVKGRGGDDHIMGGDGNNRLIGKSGNDLLGGGGGRDVLKGNGGEDTLEGTFGDDKLRGGSGDDSLHGGGQQDRLWGDKGDDILHGGDDRDIAFYDGNLEDYEITLVGGNYRITDLREGSPEGTDTFAYVEVLRFADQDLEMAPLFSSLSAVIEGATLTVAGPAAQSDPDYLVRVALADIFGPTVQDNSVVPLDVTVEGSGANSLFILDATGLENGGVWVRDADWAHLSQQGDHYSSPESGGLAYGYGGDDTLYGSYNDDTLDGGTGDDLIVGEPIGTAPMANSWGGDSLSGGEGADTIDGFNGDDTIIGGDGDDELWGGTDDDFIDGGDGEDVAVFQGDRADYTIYEENGQLVVDAGGLIWGKDTLIDVETLRFDDGDVSVASLQFDAHPADAFAGGRPTGSLASSMLPQPIEKPMSFEGPQPELMIA